jgi:hypothetical protein
MKRIPCRRNQLLAQEPKWRANGGYELEAIPTQEPQRGAQDLASLRATALFLSHERRRPSLNNGRGFGRVPPSIPINMAPRRRYQCRAMASESGAPALDTDDPFLGPVKSNRDPNAGRLNCCFRGSWITAASSVQMGVIGLKELRVRRDYRRGAAGTFRLQITMASQPPANKDVKVAGLRTGMGASTIPAARNRTSLEGPR